MSGAVVKVLVLVERYLVEHVMIGRVMVCWLACGMGNSVCISNSEMSLNIYAPLVSALYLMMILDMWWRDLTVKERTVYRTSYGEA